jgi:hypothetical protein
VEATGKQHLALCSQVLRRGHHFHAVNDRAPLQRSLRDVAGEGLRVHAPADNSSTQEEATPFPRTHANSHGRTPGDQQRTSSWVEFRARRHVTMLGSVVLQVALDAQQPALMAICTNWGSHTRRHNIANTDYSHCQSFRGLYVHTLWWAAPPTHNTSQRGSYLCHSKVHGLRSPLHHTR